MKTVTTLQENCEDIYEDAKNINIEREQNEEEFADTSERNQTETEENTDSAKEGANE